MMRSTALAMVRRDHVYEMQLKDKYVELLQIRRVARSSALLPVVPLA